MLSAVCRLLLSFLFFVVHVVIRLLVFVCHCLFFMYLFVCWSLFVVVCCCVRLLLFDFHHCCYRLPFSVFVLIAMIGGSVCCFAWCHRLLMLLLLICDVCALLFDVGCCLLSRAFVLLVCCRVMLLRIIYWCVGALSTVV